MMDQDDAFFLKGDKMKTASALGISRRFLYNKRKIRITSVHHLHIRT